MQDLIATLMSDYLEGRPQDEWLYAACYMSYDANEELLHWMVLHSDCDKAVALAIYWLSGPRWLAQYATSDEAPRHCRDRYNLLLEIERRYLDGGYTIGQLAFDPANDCSRGHSEDWTKAYLDQPYVRVLQDVMKLPLLGRSVDFEEGFSDWDEGMPRIVWDEYYRRLKQ